MRGYFGFVAVFLLESHSPLQARGDIDSIKEMAGCFEVTYEYAETFSPDKDYKFHPPYQLHSTEWATIVSESPDRLRLQRILVFGTDIQKHWSEEWIFQNKSILSYDKDYHWQTSEFSEEQVKGLWTQKVYQVDGGPQYECMGPWVHYQIGTQSKDFFECENRSPLPRRENRRTDYNLLSRRNRLSIESNGWNHEEDNLKILIADQTPDKTIAEEKGRNIYQRVSDDKCLPAKKYWEANSEIWADIHAAWDQVYAEHPKFELAREVDGDSSYESLFELADEYAKKPSFSHDQLRKDAKQMIEKFIH